MKIFKITLFLMILSINSLFASVATITAIKGEATIQRDKQVLIAKTGLAIEKKDIINTDIDTKMQLIFEDNTIISLGKNTTFAVKEYLFEDTKKPIAEFSIFKGAMRTITGKIGKIAPQRFKVRTKTATIGIRGTNFTVAILPNGSQKVFCTYGAINVKIKNNNFVVKQGFKIDITPKGKAKVKKFTPKELKKVNKDSLGETKKSKSKPKPKPKPKTDTKKTTNNSTTKNDKATTTNTYTNTNDTKNTSVSTTTSTTAPLTTATATAIPTPAFAKTISQPLAIQTNLNIEVTDITKELQTVSEVQKEDKIVDEQVAKEEEAARIAAEEEAARIAAED